MQLFETKDLSVVKYVCEHILSRWPELDRLSLLKALAADLPDLSDMSLSDQKVLADVESFFPLVSDPNFDLKKVSFT